MFWQKIRRSSPKNRLILCGLLVAVALAVSFAAPKHSFAISSLGPDPADLSAHGTGSGADDFSYVVSSSDYPSVAIPVTTVWVYFLDKNGTNKKITITDGDICTNDLQSAPGGGNQRDRPYGTNQNGPEATHFFVQNAGQTQRSTTIDSHLNSGRTCYSQTMELSFPTSLLQRDPDLNLYKAQFVARIDPLLSQAQNRFKIRLQDPQGKIGYSADDSAKTFGLARDYPYDGYRDYSLPFAPDCALRSNAIRSINLYDLDNPDPLVQPETMKTYVEEYDAANNFIRRVPLSIRGSSAPNIGNNTYVIRGASKAFIAIDVPVQPSHKYKLAMDHVYWVNVLQFKLPFDSVNFDSIDCSDPVIPRCGSAELNVINPEPGDTVHVDATMSYDGGSDNPSVTEARITVDNGGNSWAINSPNTTGRTVTLTSPNFVVNNPGTYNVTWTAKIDGEAPANQCTDSFVVLAHPFMQAYGGDVIAGAGFITDVTGDCAPPNDTAGIAGWSKNAPTYSGAGSQYGVFANNYIQDFISNLGRATPTALTFSNQEAGSTPTSINLGEGRFGGFFGNGPCVSYWKSKPASTSGNAITNGSLNGKSGTFVATNDLQIDQSTLTAGTHLTIYAEKDVIIRDNIEFGSAPGDANPTWASIDKIPTLKIIAQGRIFIDSAVTQLDGIYVAIPSAGYNSVASTFNDPANGTIVTCSQNKNVLGPNTSPTRKMITDCGNQLTVNGSFVANQVLLLRTYGTLRANQPGEVFNYTPEMWLAQPTTGGIGSSYQSIVGLPPVL